MSDVTGRFSQTRTEKGFLGFAQADTDDLEKGHSGRQWAVGQCGWRAESEGLN